MTTQEQKYLADIVICIDVTGSMTPHLDRVKENALRLYNDIKKRCDIKGKYIDILRVKIIAFRDYYANDAEPMKESPFFTLPDQDVDLHAFLNPLIADGGGSEDENGLEALALAFKSEWNKREEYNKRRHIIVLFTDAGAHKLEVLPKPSSYPTAIAKSFDELTDQWMGQSPLLRHNDKRLILFAPDVYPWSKISEQWTNTIHHPAQAGNGLNESDYLSILEVIANSV